MNRITFNPGQCGGRPCIRGMRIRVTDVLDLLANGLSFQEILVEIVLLKHNLSLLYICRIWNTKILSPVFSSPHGELDNSKIRKGGDKAPPL